jgi:hypothetical protein
MLHNLLDESWITESEPKPSWLNMVSLQTRIGNEDSYGHHQPH